MAATSETAQQAAAPPPTATPAKLSGEKRAAILILLLGEQAAGELFKHLSRRDVARIAREVAQLGPIDNDLAEQVLHAYYLDALRAPAEEGGPEVARRILAQASISEEIVDRLLGQEPDAPDELLPLLEAPPDVLARALQDEHPQTAALVLLHLPPRRAAKLLHALPDTLRAETVLRMATLRQVRGEVLGEVATSLQERLSSRRGQENRGGFERTATVLANLARAETKKLLDELEPSHPEEVMTLRSQLFTFESLITADDRGMQELLRSIDSGKLGMALLGAPDELVTRFTKNLSERAGTMLREEMEYLSAPLPSEQAAVRKEILDTALKLEADGRLIFQQASAEEDGHG
jgi:flagellar motor switch protein FliG